MRLVSVIVMEVLMFLSSRDFSQERSPGWQLICCENIKNVIEAISSYSNTAPESISLSYADLTKSSDL